MKAPWEMTKDEFDVCFGLLHPIHGVEAKNGFIPINIVFADETELTEFVNTSIAKNVYWETQNKYYPGMRNYHDRMGNTWYIDHNHGWCSPGTYSATTYFTHHSFVAHALSLGMAISQNVLAGYTLDHRDPYPCDDRVIYLTYIKETQPHQYIEPYLTQWLQNNRWATASINIPHKEKCYDQCPQYPKPCYCGV